MCVSYHLFFDSNWTGREPLWISTPTRLQATREQTPESSNLVRVPNSATHHTMPSLDRWDPITTLSELAPFLERHSRAHVAPMSDPRARPTVAPDRYVPHGRTFPELIARIGSWNKRPLADIERACLFATSSIAILPGRIELFFSSIACTHAHASGDEEEDTWGCRCITLRLDFVGTLLGMILSMAKVVDSSIEKTNMVRRVMIWLHLFVWCWEEVRTSWN